jgi:hypothetical protein
VLVVLLASTIVGVGSIPASAHCSLGPFDAAIRFSDNVWVGEIVDGKEIDDPRTPYALTLRVDDVLSGKDPGPEVTILAMPCKKLNGIAPSTIPDYVGIKGVFAIADVPTGFFYVETFQPEGDPVAAAEAVLADPDPFDPSDSAPAPTVSPVVAAPAAAPQDGGSSAAVPIALGVVLIVGVGGGLVLRSRSQRSRASQRRGPAKARPAQKAGTKPKLGTSKGGQKTKPAKARR